MAGKSRKRQNKLARQEARTAARQAGIPMDAIHPQPRATETRSLIYEKQSLHIGPLPSPETVHEYSLLIPDAPERLMGMWERQAAHRQKIENRASLTETWQRFIGQFGALGIVFGAGWLSYTFAMNDKDLKGTVALVGGLTALLALIVFRRK